MQRVLTTVTLLGLLVATAAAFAITEHLKQIKSPLFGVKIAKEFSPTCRCAESRATIGFQLRQPDRVTVTIVDSSKRAVATLVSAIRVPRKEPRVFRWAGRTDAGTRAQDGVYYPEIYLVHARHRFLLLGNRIVLDTVAPKVLSARVGHRVLLAGPGQSIAIRYALSEKANAVVYIGGNRIIRGRTTRTEDKIKWAGTLHGRPLSAGTYVLSVGARDAAGNETPASDRKDVTVVVRYIELAPGRITVRAGARFSVHVKTHARRYAWRLGGRHGARRSKLLRLRAPTTRGTYHLFVSEGGHTETAVVKVRAK